MRFSNDIVPLLSEKPPTSVKRQGAEGRLSNKGAEGLPEAALELDISNVNRRRVVRNEAYSGLIRVTEHLRPRLTARLDGSTVKYGAVHRGGVERGGYREGIALRGYFNSVITGVEVP